MESSTISFDKIPLLAKGKIGQEVQVDKLTTIYSRHRDGTKRAKGQGRTVSTNTGPDIIHMLDSLKREILPKISLKEERKFNTDKKILDVSVSSDSEDLRQRRKRNIAR